MLRRVSLFDGSGSPTTQVPIGGDLTVEVELLPFPRRSDSSIVLEVCDRFGTLLAEAHSQVVSCLDLSSARSASARCVMTDIRLLPGEYLLNLAVGDRDSYLDRVDGAASVSIEPVDLYGTGRLPPASSGLIAMSARWENVG